MALGILIKMFLVGTIYSTIFFINKIFCNSCNLFGAVEKINKWTHGQHFHNKMVSLNEYYIFCIIIINKILNNRQNIEFFNVFVCIHVILSILMLSINS